LKRINVVGSTGSGKSTFSKKLAEKLGVPRIEMDAIFWEPNWTQPTEEVFYQKLEKAIEGPEWILDGNYSRTQKIKWKSEVLIIWIDYSFSRTLYQSLTRAFRRLWMKNELWPGTGNRESLQRIFSKDSIILWMLQHFWKVRKRYETLMTDPNYSHLRFIRLRSPRECQKFLDSLEKL